MSSRPWPALAGPQPVTPMRRPDSIRRTTTVDGHRPDGPDGAVELSVRGRDLFTGAIDAATELDACTATIRTRGADSYELIELDASRHEDELRGLIGTSGKAGFRRRLRAALEAVEPRESVMIAALDDVAILTSLSRVALQQRSHPVDPLAAGQSGSASIGVCAGWRDGGAMSVEIRRGASPLLTLGAPAPTASDDPLAWHTTPMLAPLTFRRARRFDLSARAGSALVDVEGMFRDSYVNRERAELIVHEYTLLATIDPQREVLVECSALARALPGPDCEVASGSAARLAGAALVDVQSILRDMANEETCTHLTDHLRGLSALGTLAKRMT